MLLTSTTLGMFSPSMENWNEYEVRTSPSESAMVYLLAVWWTNV